MSSVQPPSGRSSSVRNFSELESPKRIREDVKTFLPDPDVRSSVKASDSPLAPPTSAVKKALKQFNEALLSKDEKSIRNAIKILKEKNALEARDVYNRTPLIQAVMQNSEMAIAALLEERANLSAKNSFGDSALAIAIQFGVHNDNKALVCFLEKAPEKCLAEIIKSPPLLHLLPELLEYIDEKSLPLILEKLQELSPSIIATEILETLIKEKHEVIKYYPSQLEPWLSRCLKKKNFKLAQTLIDLGAIGPKHLDIFKSIIASKDYNLIHSYCKQLHDTKNFSSVLPYVETLKPLPKALCDFLINTPLPDSKNLNELRKKAIKQEDLDFSNIVNIPHLAFLLPALYKAETLSLRHITEEEYETILRSDNDAFIKQCVKKIIQDNVNVPVKKFIQKHQTKLLIQILTSAAKENGLSEKFVQGVFSSPSPSKANELLENLTQQKNSYVVAFLIDTLVSQGAYSPSALQSAFRTKNQILSNAIARNIVKNNPKDAHRYLVLAVEYGNDHVAQILLQAKHRNTLEKNSKGDTLLTLAIKKGFDGIIELLVDLPDREALGLLGTKDGKGKSPLELAIEYGQKDLAQIYLNHISLTEAEAKKIYTLAMKKGWLDIASLVVPKTFILERTKTAKNQTRYYMWNDTSGEQQHFTLIREGTSFFGALDKTHRIALGEGGFGQVFKGIMSDGTLIAIKKLDAKASNSENSIQQLFDDPNIVKSLGIWRVRSKKGGIKKWMLIELANGGGLDKQLHRFHNDEKNCRNLLAQLASGLSTIHRKKIIHRDLKPLNILIFKNPKTGVETFKIADFGLAKKLNQPFLTEGAGTPGYYAPEMLSDEPPGYNEKADIFSLGITLCKAYFADYKKRVGRAESPDREDIFPKEPKEGTFEHLLWLMVSPDPLERPSAQEIPQFLGQSSR